MEQYMAYVKTNITGYIIAINSSAFLMDPSDWTQIDSGSGDKYHHPQGNYLPGPLMAKDGAYRYKLVEVSRWNAHRRKSPSRRRPTRQS